MRSRLFHEARLCMRVRSFLLAVAVITACGGSDSATPPSGDKNVTLDIFTIGDSFSPTFAELHVGDTARWNFTGGSDNMGHNVRFTPLTPGAPANINVLRTGTAARVFTIKGTFNYVCDVHPGMQAQVIVQ
jgi:plastocyanin